MTSATVKPTVFNTVRRNIRKTRRAYIGAHVMAFEFAQKRASFRMEQFKEFGESIISRGEGVEATAMDVYEAAREKVTDLMPGMEVKKTINVKPTRVFKKSKSVDLSTDITPKAKTPKTPKTSSTAKAKTAAPADKYAAYVASVLKYDPAADKAIIKKIVDHCGIALASRDGKFVACSDAAERETVAASWLVKKLGLQADAPTLDAKVGAVCEIMKADRMKSRVTFYYLLAKAEGKLADL